MPLARAQRTSLTIAPSSVTLHAGDPTPVAVSATATLDTGSLEAATEAATWTLADISIATVSNAPGTRGMIAPTGTTPGMTTVRASVCGVTSPSAVVTVLPAP